MDRETYLFHQTPKELAAALIAKLPISPEDRLYEPFKGEGAFYDSFPAANPRSWSELEQGRDYKDYDGEYDWVITNPPFKLDTGTKRINAFWFLLDYYSQRAKKGIAFLGNDRCFSTLTPKRIALLESRGWGIKTIVVCNVKKWRGRYFLIVLMKGEGVLQAIEGNF